MKISVKGFIYHKDAESFEDCFDRYGVNIANNKFCVSDGVSNSFFPGIWAELLVDNFINTEGNINIMNSTSLKSIQTLWLNKVSEIVNRPNQKFYVKNLFNQGRPAAATFVGLSFFTEGGKHKWESFALGDSFLFFVPKHIKNLDLDFEKVNYLSSKQNFVFDNFPDFFDSRSPVSKGKIKWTSKDLKEGTFYLMTDALSEWFILERQRAILEMRKWNTQQEFEKSVVELRKSRMQNDDSAILIIDIVDDNLPSLDYTTINVTPFPSLAQDEKSYSLNKTYNEEVRQISERFIVKHDEGNHFPKINIQEDNYPVIEDKLPKVGKSSNIKEQPSRTKNRGFLEKNIDALLNFLFNKSKNKAHKHSVRRAKITNVNTPDALSENLNPIATEDSIKPDESRAKDGTSQEIDSITGKF